MNKFFNMDSPIMVALSRMADMVILSVLWLVCCLPIFTIGPATAAMYYVTLKWAREDEVRIAETFFQGFKKNFKQGVALNLIFIVVGVILALDCVYMYAVGGTAGTLSAIAFLVLEIWLLCIMFYTYPLQAQFINPIRQTLLNAAILSMRKLGSTLVVFVVHMVPFIVMYFSWELFVRAIPVWVVVLPGVAATLCGKIFVKLFAPYVEPAKEETEIEE